MLVDNEVMEYEKQYPNAWKIVLNIPEFLVHSNLRQMLAEADQYNRSMAFRFRSMIMSGNDSIPLKRFTSLLKQRSQYIINPKDTNEKFGITSYSRFLHCYPFGEYRFRSTYDSKVLGNGLQLVLLLNINIHHGLK